MPTDLGVVRAPQSVQRHGRKSDTLPMSQSCCYCRDILATKMRHTAWWCSHTNNAVGVHYSAEGPPLWANSIVQFVVAQCKSFHIPRGKQSCWHFQNIHQTKTESIGLRRSRRTTQVYNPVHILGLGLVANCKQQFVQGQPFHQLGRALVSWWDSQRSRDRWLC
jgi:hypothetical protein